MSSSRITLSLLDRLSDSNGRTSRGKSIEDLKQSVYRDLSALLNTKLADDDTAESYPALADSLISYGLLDITSLSLKNPSDRGRLRRAIELSIRRFEPRLSSVSVTVEEQDEYDPVLRFRVDGLLKVKPHSQRISFDTVLQSDTCRFLVMED